MSKFEPAQWAKRRARRLLSRRVVPVANDRVLATNPDGRTLFLHAHDTSLTPTILLRGTWEPGTTRLFCRLLRPGARVVEVGANIGWYTLLAAERVGPSGSVTAFEPNPVVHELLHLNVLVNNYLSRCRLVPAAVSDVSGEAEFHVTGSFTGGGRLDPFSATEQRWIGQSETRIRVEVTTLDEELAADPRVDVLKIDAEGAEPQILAGAASVLTASPDLKLVFEFTPDKHGAEFLEQVQALGFGLYAINRWGLARPTSVDSLLASTVIATDVLARR